MKYDYFCLGFVDFIEKFWAPYIKIMFNPKIKGLENLKACDEKILIVSNHNIGALIESHLLLFLYKKNFSGKRRIFGFTHPSLFKIPLINGYFKAIGAVPSTYDAAQAVFDDQNSLLIFPGGNAQALRGIWKYKVNNFRDSHGWARIAIQNKVKVLVVEYKNTHFVNPVIISSSWLSKILILPYLLKVKVFSVTLSQILFGLLSFEILSKFDINLALNISISILVFVLTVLIPILPIPIEMKIHPAIDPAQFSSQEELEDYVMNLYK